MRLRQIDEADLALVRERKTNRLPFGRERREGIHRRRAWLFRRVDQQRDRRLEAHVSGERDQFIGIRRTFDQHDVRIESLERAHDTAGRTGPVMANAEQMDAVVRHAGC